MLTPDCRSIPVNRFGRNRRLIFERPDSLSAGVVRYRDRYLRDVVLKVRFRKLMTNTGSVRIRVAARLSGNGNESGIDRDSDNVLTGRHGRLAVSAR